MVSSILVIIGKTASGKDTVTNKLVTEHGFKKLITYTTRPLREGEIRDVTYHYISDEDFKQKIGDGFFAEWKSYKATDGVWYYGSAKEDYENADDKTVIILTPDGYKYLRGRGYDLKSIYIYANDNTIRKRLNERGDKKEEAERRIRNDNADFKGVENLVNKIAYNNEGDNINYVVDKVLTHIGGFKKFVGNYQKS